MRTVVLASLRVHARRYVAAVLAVVLGVGFVVVTATLAAATKAGMLNDLASSYRGADVVVTGLAPEAADAVLRRLGAAGPVAVDADAHVPVSAGGTRLADETEVGTVATAASLRWQHLASGRFPTGAGEALVDTHDAREQGVHVGDLVTVGAGRDAVRARVVGLTGTDTGPLTAPVYLTWPDLRRLGASVFVTDVTVGGGRDVAAARAAGLPRGATALSADDYLQQQAAKATRDVDVVATMVLVFGAIALFVSVLVIANTFTVLLAQRLRDLALLRCVGATRRQVVRSVRREALVVGAASATLGVLVGLGVARVLVLVAGHVLPGLPTADAHVDARWLAGAWLVGLLVTLVASVFPAHRSTRIQPLQALQPLGAVEVRTRAGAARVALGALLGTVGVALLVLAVTTHRMPVMIAGGFLSFLGVLALGPLLVPACVRVAGLATGRLLGVPGRLATANALRNPRRTAATAASLLVGTTLVTGMVTGLATIRGSVDREMDVEYPVDVTLTSTHALPASTRARVAAVDGVERAVAVPGATARVTQGRKRLGEVTVLGPAPTRGLLRGGAEVADPRPGRVYVPWSVAQDLGLDTGRPVVLRVGGRSLRVQVTDGSGWKDAVVVAAPALRRLAGTSPRVRAVWARAGDGADADALGGAVRALGRSTGADAGGGLANRAYVDLQLDVVAIAVLVLLGVALVIALLGIGNTLGLSVLERRREHAVLRALGLTRAQLRATLAVEAVLLAAVTSVIGVALGAAYAWVGVRTVLDTALDQSGVHLVLPTGQLVLVVLVAAVAGLAACVLPARAAARVAPAQGLAEG